MFTWNLECKLCCKLQQVRLKQLEKFNSNCNFTTLVLILNLSYTMELKKGHSYCSYFWRNAFKPFICSKRSILSHARQADRDTKPDLTSRLSSETPTCLRWSNFNQGLCRYNIPSSFQHLYLRLPFQPLLSLCIYCI